MSVAGCHVCRARGIEARSDETRSGSAEGKSPVRQDAPETDGMTPKETLKMEEDPMTILQREGQAFDNWTPDERTVRACIEALPHGPVSVMGHFNVELAALRNCRVALEALLPKPDPAKALAEEYIEACARGEVKLDNGKMTSYAFARWLITSGHYQPKGDV